MQEETSYFTYRLMWFAEFCCDLYTSINGDMDSFRDLFSGYAKPFTTDPEARLVYITALAGLQPWKRRIKVIRRHAPLSMEIVNGIFENMIHGENERIELYITSRVARQTYRGHTFRTMEDLGKDEQEFFRRRALEWYVETFMNEHNIPLYERSRVLKWISFEIGWYKRLASTREQ